MTAAKHKKVPKTAQIVHKPFQTTFYMYLHTFKESKNEHFIPKLI